jgi:3',5'-cyclic-AMP phosphodiesterase
VSFAALLLSTLLWCQRPAQETSFRFAILGDRTGEPQAGVYQQVWKEVAAEDPSFVLSVGDTIQGQNDEKAAMQWRGVDQLLLPYRRYTLYLAPGNHDVWSAASERLFRQRAGGLHYSFDYGRAHFTILDNSRTEELSNEELAFLESDLKAYAAQPLKFVISHRPSWLLNVALQNPNFALHQLARRYGVKYVIAGHVHQMMHFELEGITYVSMASSGGHLRSSGAYDDGWFFAHALVEVDGKNITFEIREVGPPNGHRRVTKLTDWGMRGLLQRPQPSSAPAK